MGFFKLIGLDEVYSFKKGVRTLFVLLLLTGIILLADQNVMSPNITAIEHEFGITDREIGFVGSAFTLVGALVTLVWGYLTDKYSRKWLLVLALLLGEVPCFLTGFAQSYEQLLVLRVLTGIGLGGTVPLAFSILGDLFTERQRPRAQAWYDAITTVGVLLGMIVAGFLGPVYGWRIPFILVSAPNFLFILGMILFGEEPAKGAGEQEIRDLVLSGRKYRGSLKLSDYLHLFRNKTNLMLFLQGIPGTVAWGIIPFYLITFYERYKGFTVQLGTVLLLVLGVGTIAGKLFGGIFGNYLYNKDRRYLPVFLGLAQIVGVVPILVTLRWPSVPNPGLGDLMGPMLYGFVGAFLISTSGPNVKAMLMNVNLPEHRGAISSVFNLTDSIGAGFGPLVGGLLSYARGLDFAMTTSALFWVPCGVLLIIVALFIQEDAMRVHRAMQLAREEMERNGNQA
ncbi:MFS transporter [Coprothermobacteraceae bacterium]|nr:MFS transporter [Coprothermobacteraceae bacterium]